MDAEHAGEPLKYGLARHARVEVIVTDSQNTDSEGLFELLVNLGDEKVVHKQHQIGKHSYIDGDYMKQVEAACLQDANVQKQLASMDFPEGSQVIVEPWAYATDGENDMSKRISMVSQCSCKVSLTVLQCWFYISPTKHKDSNHYAYPLDICAEVSESLLVTKMYRLPTKPSQKVHQKATTFDHGRLHSPADSEYHPALRPEPRTTTKPLHVSQPQGPSFIVDGQLITWEKWRFRVGFNYREGLTLHDIHYDNRSLFYRLSLAEMFVPYGDPRPPFQRKAAFDLGNDGAGINANNLQLGCDCLGKFSRRLRDLLKC